MQKQEITNLFSRFNSLNVLIIGDVMLDSYIWGNADRISRTSALSLDLVYDFTSNQWFVYDCS